MPAPQRARRSATLRIASCRQRQSPSPGTRSECPRAATHSAVYITASMQVPISIGSVSACSAGRADWVHMMTRPPLRQLPRSGRGRREARQRPAATAMLGSCASIPTPPIGLPPSTCTGSMVAGASVGSQTRRFAATRTEAVEDRPRHHEVRTRVVVVERQTETRVVRGCPDPTGTPQRRRAADPISGGER